MSGTKPNPKASVSSVSKGGSTTTTNTSKTSSGTASSSKSHSSQNIKPKEQSHTATSSVKDTASSSSSSATPSKFYMACRNNEIDTVRSLLPKLTLGEINQIEPNGSTALHAAAYYGHYDIVKLLLSKGAQCMMKNRYGSTPYDEAKTKEIKELFQRSDEPRRESNSRFGGEKGASFEWIFVKGDPSSYASFNRGSLFKCHTNEEFDRLCRGIRQYYVNEDGPLAKEKDIGSARLLIDKAIRENDPTQVVRAYTAQTGFYTRLNTDLAQMPTHWSGIKHERNVASIMIFHPVFQKYSFTGETYRGMIMSQTDLNEYVIGSIFMNKTFLSTSKLRIEAESFFQPKKASEGLKVLCKYGIKHPGTALAIEDLSDYPYEKEVLILPYAVFKVKYIRKTTDSSGVIIEIDIEEDDAVKWTTKNSHHTSQMHTSVKKKTSGNQNNDSYAKMFKDSQEKGEIDPADLAKWTQESFGIDPAAAAYAKIYSDAKKGKFSKSDVAKWKKENGLSTSGDGQLDSDSESYDGENNTNTFTASNQQSYATSKKFSTNDPLAMKDFMKHFQNNSDDD